MSNSITLREPAAEDGMSVHRLVGQCAPLDPNSVYCNLLQASHFAGTSVAAEMDGELVGFISGYRLPERPNTLFVWQVAVGEPARGQGLAGRMIENILSRSGCQGVEYLETTITADNQASWALFTGAARRLNAELNESVMFEKSTHFKGEHDSEMLVRIGPFST